MLSDAELVLGLSRHLSAYAAGPAKAGLEQLEFAGQVFDMAFRLRNSGTSTPERIRAIATEAYLGQRQLRDALATLETLGWMTVQRDRNNRPLAVTETIPAPALLVQAAPSILPAAGVTDCEWAALTILRATTLQPLLVDDALHTGTAAVDAQDQPVGDAAADEAIRHLTSIGLLKKIVTDDGMEVVFNPNVWGSDEKVAQAALYAAKARATSEVAALLEEVVAKPGMPETAVTATEPKWITFAVAQGLVQRSVIQTSTGEERSFLFTPHLNRSPFGATAGDASGQVRQLVGSMIYAATYAEYKLYNPAAFVSALIRNGEAGDASPIGTDYPMLETAGIVRVVPGTGDGRFRLELLQSEVAEDALQILSERDDSRGNPHDLAALRAQQRYGHIDRERARLALDARTDDVEQERLISALRDETTRRAFRKPLSS
ncbi:hypothetical protein GCM10010191_88640 [Actinomadura vinacea]|uniref:Uncharacterized protein n=2 Tax=Actinomadura vinacea TaxID=115336 RepID=A0ABN3KFT4_9ACTN